MREIVGKNREMNSPVLTVDAMRALMGIERPVALTAEAMAHSLRVTFLPGGRMTPRLTAFTAGLQRALVSCGVTVVPYDQACAKGRKGKIAEGIVIIAPGELEMGNLPVDHVSNLRTTTAVGIIDGPCPTDAYSQQQEKLNRLVETLAWSIVQVAVYVEDERWTITTMNGAIIPCDNWHAMEKDVYATLVPKLAAPVVPPHASDFEVVEGGIDLGSPQYAPYVEDFERSAPLWAATGLMLFHTSMNSLEFRSPYYKRIAAAYLDRRSGMSYGFLARQVATAVRPAMAYDEGIRHVGTDGWVGQGFTRAHGSLYVLAAIGGSRFIVEIPKVSMLSTRSGCDKAHIDGHRDLMLLTLTGGRIQLTTPRGVAGNIDFRPSYDTLTILAHGLANALIAAVALRHDPADRFARTLTSQGMALAHWHGDVDRGVLPAAYVGFGDDNPPVSCSTHQAALYTLGGKLRAFAGMRERHVAYEGDVHVEPHHGINVTWPTLTGLAQLLVEGGAKAIPHTAAAHADRR
jgi:hypothetical protein